jgi:signal transduction histidine kinase/CheY-like chemotaxis protein
VSQQVTVTEDFEFLGGGGQVGALMRAHDWSDSPAGPPERWPQALRTVVALLLQSRFPMFVAWGQDLAFLYNDPYAEILGSKHPRALGARFYDVWSEIWPDISPLIDAAMAGRATYREDLPLVMNRKGYDEQTWFTFSYSPVRDDNGKVGGMFCAVFETTEKVLAEQALRENNDTLERRVNEALAERKLLADIVEGTNAFVQVVARDYTLLAINKASADEFERIFGVRPKTGDNMLQLLANKPEHRHDVEAVWGRALAGEEFTEIGEFGDPARARRSYEMRFNTLRDRDGQPIGAYQFVYDVTERIRDQERLRNAEAALRQAQKMESLGQLTGGVAHDFNNLLAVFASGLQIIERMAAHAVPSRVLDAMRRAVARGTGLTRHLLTFSRRRPVNPESLDIAAHLKGMRQMLDSSLGGHIQVHTNVAPALWPVEVDAGEMELAILNLALNARDAMPEGGDITISVDNVRVAREGTLEEFVTIAVTDTGLGMSADVQSRAFEPFFTTKDVNKGSGLGLPQVYGFAQQSGGHVAIDSAVGRGTTVTIFLPRTLLEPAASVERATDSAVHLVAERRGQALLVEDDPEVSALTRELLVSLGFSVTHVATAEAALQALTELRRVEVVVSDIMMPGGVTGVQLAREIRQGYPRLPIVLTTGYIEAAADVKDGEFALLPKPFTLEALADALGVGVASGAR